MDKAEEPSLVHALWASLCLHYKLLSQRTPNFVEVHPSRQQIVEVMSTPVSRDAPRRETSHRSISFFRSPPYPILFIFCKQPGPAAPEVAEGKTLKGLQCSLFFRQTCTHIGSEEFSRCAAQWVKTRRLSRSTKKRRRMAIYIRPIKKKDNKCNGAL